MRRYLMRWLGPSGWSSFGNLTQLLVGFRYDREVEQDSRITEAVANVTRRIELNGLVEINS